MNARQLGTVGLGDQQRTREFEALCQSLREHLLRGSLPPTEAYWWTRIVVEEVAAVTVVRSPQPVAN